MKLEYFNVLFNNVLIFVNSAKDCFIHGGPILSGNVWNLASMNQNELSP